MALKFHFDLTDNFSYNTGMIITRIRAPMRQQIYFREQFKTTDILAKEDVNRTRHEHNLKQTKKYMRYKWQDRFEHNFNVRVNKFLKENRRIVSDQQREAIAERQRESINARYMRRLNVL